MEFKSKALKMWQSISNKRYWFFYIFLCAVIIFPLLGHGFILTLDMVFTPKLPAPTSVTNSYIWQGIMHLANFLLPGQVVEKIIIFSILLMCGIAMHQLIRTESSWPKYFAGIFYTINPFTYERWMAGQYLVLFGYAVLPIVIKTLFSFINSPSLKKTIRLAALYSFIGIFDLHLFVLALICGSVFVMLQLIRLRNAKSKLNGLLKYSGLSLLCICVLSSYWLLGILRGTSQISQTLGGITNKDFAAFTTAPNPHFGLFFNVESMYGIWLEPLHHFIMPNKNTVVWVILYFCILGLTITGIYSHWKINKLQTLGIGIIGLIGGFIALGINAPIIGEINDFILTKLPFMNGFREPEKFSALLVIAYCYFAAYGVEMLLKHITVKSPQLHDISALLLLCLPLLYVPTMLFGFVGQLKPVQYPASWYQFNNQLSTHHAKGTILFLPWHEYMSYDFAPRIIANPAANFFYTSNVVSGTDAEFGEVFQAYPDPTSNFIVNQILDKPNDNNLGTKLNQIHVQYILLATGYDVHSYRWLYSLPGLKVMSEQPGLTVFKNIHYK